MKQKSLKQILSILLAMVMLIGLLPIAAIPAFAEETTYTKLGEIPTVTVKAGINPKVGGKNKAIEWYEIESPVDQGVYFATTYWQKFNKGTKKWEMYGPVPYPVMEEGTYRIFMQLRSEANDEKEYYALTANTSLYVNDVMWTMDPDYKVLSYKDGYGYVWFHSPEFVLSKDSEHSGGNLINLGVKTPPTKTNYVVGEYFDPAGMEVCAYYDNSATVPVSNYLVTNGLSLQKDQTSVTISYSEGIKTVTTEVPITIVSEWDNDLVFEVYSWDDFKKAFSYSAYRGESYTIKLKKNLYYDAADAKRSDTVLVDVHLNGCSVTFDFNGHMLSCRDTVSSSDLQSVLSDFIRINMHPLNAWNPIELRFIDSVGGGGVYMESHRAWDNQLGALHIVDARNYYIGGLFQTCADTNNKLIIDSGNYTLEAKTDIIGVGSGTLAHDIFYRGTVIADALDFVEINGGNFTAKSDGVLFQGDDMCARELSAFATCSNYEENYSGVASGNIVINGGSFISDGYAVHHFDHSYDMDETRSMKFPMINGGIFSGSVGYVGMSYTYDNYDTTGFGMKEYREKSAADIINSDALVRCIKGGKMYELDELTVGDLHESTSLYVLSDSLFNFKTYPITGDQTDLERYQGQYETFKVQYWVPSGMQSNQITPYISVTPTGGAETTSQTAEKVIHYADYPKGLTVKAGISFTIDGEVICYENTYNIAVSEIPAAPGILAQPQSMTVAPGECAEAMVVANHAASYQWYYLYDGSTPMKLTESLVSALGGGITGYMSPRLSVTLDGVTKESFYCVVTGTDGSTVKTNRITFTYGEKPSTVVTSGGEFYDGADAEFKLWAKYAERVTWYVISRRSGSVNIYTLEKFAEETGCEYGTTHRGYPSGLYSASVLFKNVDASWAGKYAVGYALENSLGKVNFDPENTIPFTLAVIKPEIISSIEAQSCKEGESLTLTFEAEDMVSPEWIFEKADEDGIMVAYTVDDMKTLFPDTSFEASVLGNVATLSISNARIELCEYRLYANALGSFASSSAGTVRLNVFSVMGATVSGKVTSFGSETDDITVELYAEGSASAYYTVTVKGNTAEYSIEGVGGGTYTLKISKKNHVTREYTVTVGTDPVVQDAKIHLKGDIDGNGKVNVGDTTKVYSHVKKTSLITDEYILLCADVSGDGRINVGDTTKVYAHVKKTSLLW